MVERAQPLGAGGRLGIAVAAAIPLLIAATTVAVVAKAEASRGLTPADWVAIRFIAKVLLQIMVTLSWTYII